MSGSPPQQESKHTPLDEAAIQADVERWQEQNHITDLLAELRRTRRLLDAGQRMHVELEAYLIRRMRGTPSVAALESSVVAYQEAAK